MLAFMKTKKFANIVIDDYVVRMVESHGQQMTDIKQLRERPIPAGLIEQGKVVDEIGFYDFMQQLVRDWKLKNAAVRFYVPDSLVIMRPVDFPARLQGKEIREHFMFEMGQSLHLPFQNPVLDVHVHPSDKSADIETSKATLFAAPEEEIRKYIDLFSDVSLRPHAADIRSLGLYRYFYETDQSRKDEIYLFFELNLTSTNISVFSDNQLDFTRHQQLEVDTKDWRYTLDQEKVVDWTYTGSEPYLDHLIDEQMNEIERIMDFYSYSLHKGTRNITHIILSGDYPKLDQVKKKMEQHLNRPTSFLKVLPTSHEIHPCFIPALGLVLKGRDVHAS
ncbi:pilus assembly protein PilM [Bacillus sp. FJAT-50079]|uniref:type IV pilus biogenesis protein PilM n=1 Tax=Bacillus sp. FJAT-50079 TaxID=2833577 RepID=UPI001BC9534F|nr:pilus assembly protein PilM [Bacillus sp. FJAT-50079]MBS4208947.1 pilus assembly protein PilM [Bacillus sp. FJAT-50079]